MPYVLGAHLDEVFSVSPMGADGAVHDGLQMSTIVPAGCSCPLAWSDFIIAQPLFLPLLSGLYPVASF